MPVTVRNWQDPHYLTNLTHLDGRNAYKAFALRPYFSELAWMKERLLVIASHLVYLAPFVGKPVKKRDIRKLIGNINELSSSEAEKIVRIEKKVNHDVKALELYLLQKLPDNISHLKWFVMFGLGSEDINSIAYARLVARSRDEVLVPELYGIIRHVSALARKEKDTVMIGRTHGLPAGVTTFGKELANPLFRLCDEVKTCATAEFNAKLTGEVGVLHSLGLTDRRVDWLSFGDRFIRSMGVRPYHGSTQIVPYDSMIAYLHSVYRINCILMDMCKNMWLYVLLGYVRTVKKDAEVGSSGMPHKVNPMYFEGAEGGLVMANGIIETMARSLMVNRLQRDFSDSTIRRNMPLVMAYSLLSYQSLTEALRRTEVNSHTMADDLSAHAEVWIEPIKIRMILTGEKNAYELLRQKTRGNTYTRQDLESLVASLHIKKGIIRDIYRIIRGNVKNPYPGRIVNEAVAKAVKLTSV